MEKKKKVLLALIPVVIIAVLAICYFAFKPSTTTGSKNVTITVVNDNGSAQTYNVKTDAEYLRQAMEETKGLEFSGEESEYGLMVLVVNGVTADYNVDQSYWAFYVNGDYITLNPLTAQEIQNYKDFILSVDKVQGSFSSVENIINEETQGYFLGDKSVDDVVKNIQGRVQLFINEKR